MSVAGEVFLGTGPLARTVRADQRVAALEVSIGPGARRQVIVLFKNRRGVRVLYAPGSYGFEQGLAEAAVLRWGVQPGEQWAVTDGKRWAADAIRGWLSEEESIGLLREVAALPFALGACEYFLGCGNAAEGLTSHPILGQVPTCSRCAGMFDLNLEAVES